jgi:hypothetical protein
VSQRAPYSLNSALLVTRAQSGRRSEVVYYIGNRVPIGLLARASSE